MLSKTGGKSALDHKKNTFSKDQSMFIGCAYYPEYWPESRWETDLKLMKQAGFNVIRMAEYSWVKLEPEEGVFCFDWLDRIIALCAKHDMLVILGTPTDSMPAWLARKYPDALAQKEDGTRVPWGGRKNNCYSSEAFNRLSKTIAKVMADHYKDNDTIIGWQIGNEYGPPESLSETQKLAFQQYLKEKYRTLYNLNEKWGNAFWGHTFTAWEEIPVPLYWRFNPS
ncbi:MAG TPA: beta-galactosidase, partial [Bacteroidales bacterium]|nr:beta-galactosidase [Bacteroidales bacterium]